MLCARESASFTELRAPRFPPLRKGIAQQHTCLPARRLRPGQARTTRGKLKDAARHAPAPTRARHRARRVWSSLRPWAGSPVCSSLDPHKRDRAHVRLNVPQPPPPRSRGASAGNFRGCGLFSHPLSPRASCPPQGQHLLGAMRSLRVGAGQQEQPGGGLRPVVERHYNHPQPPALHIWVPLLHTAPLHLFVLSMLPVGINGMWTST